MASERRSAALTASLTRRGSALGDVLDDKLQRQDVHPLVTDKTRLFTYHEDTSPPWWQGYLDLPRADFADARRIGAVVAVEVTRANARAGTQQHVLFSFGPVRHLIKQEHLVPNFGLELAAHGIEPGLILAADTVDVVEARRQRTQLARGRDLSFVDPDAAERSVRRITARATAGFPGSPTVVSGAENIRFSTAVTAGRLPYLAKQLFRAFIDRSDPVVSVGNVVGVTDGALIDSADDALVEAFLSGTGVEFAFPGMIDPDAGTLISFRGSPPRPPLDPVDLAPYRADLGARTEKGRRPTSRTLKNASVVVTDGAGGSLRAIPFYRCLSATIDVGDQTLTLLEGRWYAIRSDYLEEVGRENSHLDVAAPPFLPRMDGDHEEVDYNMRLATALNGVFVDRTSLLRGSRSNIEPCDILRLDGNELVFTHVKPGNGASTLSHLFYQAQVSTVALLLDSAARDELGRVVEKMCSRKDLGLPAPKKTQKFTRDNTLSPAERARRARIGTAIRAGLDQKIKAREFRVEFVILDGDGSKTQGARDLPVFSRVSLARAAREFRRLGIPLSLRIVADRRRGDPAHTSP